MTRAVPILMTVLLGMPATALADPLRVGGGPFAEAIRRPVITLRLEVDGEVDRFNPPRAARAAAQSSPGNQRRSFWRSPWPYVLGGAAAAAIIIVATRGDGYRPPSSMNPGTPPG